VLGDQGIIEFVAGKVVRIEDPGMEGDDLLSGGADDDLIIGGLGSTRSG
jgi:hypothetical protein